MKQGVGSKNWYVANLRLAYRLLLTAYCCAANRRRGSTLLYALLIVGTSLAAVVSFSSIIILGMNRSAVSYQSLQKFYQAESGVERALFRIRQAKLLPGELGMTSDCGLGGAATAGCDVQASYASTRELVFPRIKQDESVEVALLDTSGDHIDCNGDTGIGVSWAACVDKLKVSCVDYDGVSPTGSLVVTITKLSPDSQWKTSDGAGSGIKQSQQYCNSGTAVTYDVDIAESYIVKLRAIRSDVKINNLHAEGYEGIGGSLTWKNLTSRLELVGTAGNSILSQRIIVAMPGRNSLPGLYDYVLYSECGITKPYNIPAGSQLCP